MSPPSPVSGQAPSWERAGDVAYWTAGEPDAPVLLCLHGIGSNADAFLPQLPLAASAGRRLVAWDAPGYRHSADPVGAPGVSGWARSAAALARHVAGGSTGGGTGEGAALDVLGVSWGGVIATRLALDNPQLVRSLTLADSSGGAGGRVDTAEAMRSRADGFVELGPDAFAASRSAVLVSDGASDELRREVAQMMVESIRMPAYRWACWAMAEADHVPLLGGIAAPTLVVVGEHDVVTPPRASERLAAGIRAARLEVIDDAGHLANQEQPERFNHLLAEFLLNLS